VLAHWLHQHGPRADEAFVDLNCGGLSREFLETELFGHERGAFTGANASKAGLLEIADRGTVFLDEIGDIDIEVQPKLLKVLEEKRFHRLGSVRDRLVDIRLISATHRDLAQAARDNLFRSDLYFRIATVTLVVPPLRERVEDIPLLVGELLTGIKADLARPSVVLAPDAIAALQSYGWPGNIRELRNVLERALLLSDRSLIRREDLQFEATSARDPQGDDLGLTLVELERRHLERILADEQGHVGRAATRLGIPRSSLYQKIKRYEIALSRD
jgi:transcriptional regulator with PAS, ATPase and Fis domain